jgi:hypothetical protein
MKMMMMTVTVMVTDSDSNRDGDDNNNNNADAGDDSDDAMMRNLVELNILHSWCNFRTSPTISVCHIDSLGLLERGLDHH